MNIKTAVICFSNLGHPKRLGIIRLLVKSAPKGLTMHEVASRTHIPNSTLTHHVKLLEEAGLIKRQQEAQSIRCLVNISILKELSQFLLSECCLHLNKVCS